MIRKKLLFAAAFVSLGLGIAGIFLPLLPTTPFMLLAAFCFLKSSRARYKWLLSHRIFGKYIADYLTHRAIPLRAKILSLTLMWLTMGLSAYIVKKPLIAAILLIIGIAVSWHIISIRTLKREKNSTRDARDIRG